MLQERLPGFGRVGLALALSNRELDLKAVSMTEEIDVHRFIVEDVRSFDHERPEITFRVQIVAPRIRIAHMPMTVNAVSFGKVDFSTTSMVTDIDLATVLPFEPLKPQEIIIEPGEVSMWLDKLLDAQEPLQKEIRQKKIIANLSTF